MAIFHLNAKKVGRSEGRSAIAAAAYRAGCQIVDEQSGQVHDYTRKAGVLHSEIIAPGGGSLDRSALWNGIEKHHKRGDAVLAREIEISLPGELSADQRQALAVGYARELADRYGVAVDIALHEPRTVTDRDLEKDPSQHWEIDPDTGRRHNGNWHAHILMTACTTDQFGNFGKKVEVLDPFHCKRAKIENTAERERPRWAELQNNALALAGSHARVDHRSHEDRGIEDAPTVHLGPAASGYERRTGEKSDARLRREAALEAKATELETLDASISALEREIEQLKAEPELTLLDAAKIDMAEVMASLPASAPEPRRTLFPNPKPKPKPQPAAAPEVPHLVQNPPPIEPQKFKFLEFLGAKAEQVLTALRAVLKGEKPDTVQGFEITGYDSKTGRQTKAEPRQRWLSFDDYEAAAAQHGRIDLDPDLLREAQKAEIAATRDFSPQDWADPQARENAALEALETVLRDRI